MFLSFIGSLLLECDANNWFFDSPQLPGRKIIELDTNNRPLAALNFAGVEFVTSDARIVFWYVVVTKKLFLPSEKMLAEKMILLRDLSFKLMEGGLNFN